MPIKNVLNRHVQSFGQPIKIQLKITGVLDHNEIENCVMLSFRNKVVELHGVIEILPWFRK